MPLRRLDVNPLLTPADVEPTREGLNVNYTLNPAAVRFGDEILLLVRVCEKPDAEPGTVACVVFDADAGDLRIIRYRGKILRQCRIFASPEAATA